MPHCHSRQHYGVPASALTRAPEHQPEASQPPPGKARDQPWSHRARKPSQHPCLIPSPLRWNVLGLGSRWGLPQQAWSRIRAGACRDQNTQGRYESQLSEHTERPPAHRNQCPQAKPSNYTPRNLHKRNENICPNQDMHVTVYNSIIPQPKSRKQSRYATSKWVSKMYYIH